MEKLQLHNLTPMHAARPHRPAVPLATPPVTGDTVELGQQRPASLAAPAAVASTSNPLHKLLTGTARAVLSMLPMGLVGATSLLHAEHLLALSAPDDAPPDLTQDSLRVWQRGPQGAEQVDGSTLPVFKVAGVAPHVYHPVDAHDLDKKMVALAKARKRALEHLDRAHTGYRAVPKDCTLHASAFDMSYDPSDEASLGYIDQMALIGRREGFHLVARTAQGDEETLQDSLTTDAARNVTIVPLPGAGDTWIEDHGEATIKETMTVPAHVGDTTLIDDAILRDRVSRLFGEKLRLSGDDLEDEVNATFPKANFARLGAVDDRNNQEAMVALGMSANVHIRQNFSYIEGGNVLPGTLPDGDGFAIVGKDSVAVTRALLARDLDRRVTNDEVIEAIAKDLGMKPENVHPVEQPGTFHIDMAMGLLGPGQVLLNDSREAAKIQTEWLRADAAAKRPKEPPPDCSFLRRWVHKGRMGMWKMFHHDRTERTVAELQKQAEARGWYEDRAAADLTKAGLEVHRMAAVLMNPNNPAEDIANFANIRQGTNPDGERFVIALGGDKRAEAYVAQKLLHEIPCGVRRVWFLDRSLTPLTLDLSGGIKCRSKGEGSVEAGPQRIAS